MPNPFNRLSYDTILDMKQEAHALREKGASWTKTYEIIGEEKGLTASQASYYIRNRFKSPKLNKCERRTERNLTNEQVKSIIANLKPDELAEWKQAGEARYGQTLIRTNYYIKMWGKKNRNYPNRRSRELAKLRKNNPYVREKYLVYERKMAKRRTLRRKGEKAFREMFRGDDSD